MFTLDLTKNSEKSSFIYIPNFFDETNVYVINSFLEETPFMTGLACNGSQIRRKQIWFQENQEYFCEKWTGRYARWTGHKYTTQLYKIQENVKNRVESLIGTSFNPNSCLINKYENGNDVIGAHRDSLDSFGVYPIIANLSFGTPRILRIKDPETKEIVLDISLESNSLFVMFGASQKYYTHEILEDYDVKSSRYSLTFREKI